MLWRFLTWLGEGSVWVGRQLIPQRFRSNFVMMQLRRQSNLAADQAIGRAPFSWGKFFRRLFYLCVLVGIVIGLYYLNAYLQLDLALRSPLAGLHRFWLPILFLLLFATGVLVRWLYRLLGPDTPTNDFPDIDEAWGEAMAALDRAGIDPTEVPLFLVFGRPAGSWDALFAASGLPLQVRNAPAREDAPLRVFAGRDALFVTCEGASLLGRQATLMSEAPPDPALLNAPPPEPPAPLPLEAVPLPGGEALGFFDLPAGTPTAPAPAATALAPAPTAVAVADDPLAPLLAAEGGVGLLEADVGPTADAARLAARRLAILKRTDEVKRLTARLDYLCRLIAARRMPFCPVNGMLWVLPLAATSPEAEAGQVGVVCQRDRQTARDRLQVLCPSFVLVSDVDRLPGFPTLLKHVPEGPLRQKLVGPTLPLVPDLDEARERELGPQGVGWLCRTFFPTLAYRLFRLERPDEGQRWPAANDNARLVQLLGELRDRREPLARALTRGFPPDRGVPPLLGGCYLAATGADAHDQAFAAGVFRQLIENQNNVAWTADAVAEERDYDRLRRLGYAAMAVLTAVLIGAGFLLR
jgi:hypothetical protein